MLNQRLLPSSSYTCSKSSERGAGIFGESAQKSTYLCRVDQGVLEENGGHGPGLLAVRGLTKLLNQAADELGLKQEGGLGSEVRGGDAAIFGAVLKRRFFADFAATHLPGLAAWPVSGSLQLGCGFGCL